MITDLRRLINFFNKKPQKICQIWQKIIKSNKKQTKIDKILKEVKNRKNLTNQQHKCKINRLY